MSRYGLFVLLLGAGVVLAGSPGEARQDPDTTVSRAPAGAAQSRTDDGRASTDAPRGQAPEPRPETGEAGEGTIEAEAEDGPALIAVPGGSALGMSVLGNQEAPTSLVIVPWKTSELGTSIGISPMLDDSRQAVDRDVFMRALRYYQIRVSDTTP
jgi:hypothetical protein